jgi:hypothetical protein
MGFVNLCANEASIQIGIKSPEANIPQLLLQAALIYKVIDVKVLKRYFSTHLFCCTLIFINLEFYVNSKSFV